MHMETLILMAAYQFLMYILSIEDSTHVTLMLTGVYPCLMYAIY